MVTFNEKALQTASEKASANLAKKIRKLRSKKGWTQDDLAEAAGISTKFVGEVERDQTNPSLDTLARLATALDTTVSDLVTE